MIFRDIRDILSAEPCEPCQGVAERKGRRGTPCLSRPSNISPARQQIGETKFKIARQSHAACGNSRGLDDSHHGCSHAVGKVAPDSNDSSEVAIGFRHTSSAFGSSQRTRHVARCRELTRFTFVVLRRNLFCSGVLRRDLSRGVAT